MTKDEVLLKIDEIKPDYRVFKSSNTTNSSMTFGGLEFVKTYLDDKTLEIDVYLKGTDIINFNKLCKTPYYYNPILGRIFHYDSEIQFLANVYKEDFLKYLKDSTK